MNREEILNKAKECVCGQREQDYGSPEDNFETIGLFWSVYLRRKYPELKDCFYVDGITPEDVANMMMLLKIARNTGKKHIDNYVDLAGYAACGGEMLK